MRLRHSILASASARSAARSSIVLAAVLFAAACANEATSPPAPRSSRIAASLVAGQDVHRHVVSVRGAGAASALKTAIAAEGGAVESDHSDGGVLLVSGLTDVAAARIATADRRLGDHARCGAAMDPAGRSDRCRWSKPVPEVGRRRRRGGRSERSRVLQRVPVEHEADQGGRRAAHDRGGHRAPRSASSTPGSIPGTWT